ncbi:MAG TPA: DNA methyltransferase [Lacipirellulaceae bacterium]|nr:DNA methyltransferase [Lacipirellulaceae bacterium]
MSLPAEVESTTTPQFSSLTIGKIHHGDCIELMRKMDAGTVDLAFADPPFNIGYEYDEYHDRQDPDDYVAWSRAWIGEVHRVLKPGGTFWLAIGDEFAAELKVAAQHQVGFATRSWVVWYYTFGVNCTRKFSRSHAHLFHFVKDEGNFTFNAEDPQVRVPSARALVYADKRANPAGRLPDDTWVLRPQDLADGFQPGDDTWYYARVAGTFKERQGFHGCQMPEQLLGRIIRVSSNPGDVVLDPFAGSGTTLAVAKKLGRLWIGCELSDEYVRAATQRLNSIQEGEELDGPADPIASAPSTANGRKLDREPLIDRRVADKGVAQAADRGTAEPTSAASTRTIAAPSRHDVRSAVRTAVVDAFYAAHDGYSIDWLLANPSLQAAFHDACRDSGLIGGPIDWNRELLRLRKTGGFPKRGQIRKVHISDIELDAYSFAAEIAWRLTSDKYGSPSLDEILCDPQKCAYFDKTAKRFASGFKTVHYRWAALRMRKASRELVDQVKQFHFVFAKRDFQRFHAWRRFSSERYSGQKGVYLLRDATKQALYAGRALDLGSRLAQHADCSAIDDLVPQVAVITGDDLPSQEYQAAFKEHLVRSYKPKWNVRLVGLNSA